MARHWFLTLACFQQCVRGGQGGPDEFSIVAGALPDGLSMQKSFGVQSTLIFGRPTRQQTSTFTVRVQDASGSATRTFSITIDRRSPSPSRHAVAVLTRAGPRNRPHSPGALRQARTHRHHGNVRIRGHRDHEDAHDHDHRHAMSQNATRLSPSQCGRRCGKQQMAFLE